MVFGLAEMEQEWRQEHQAAGIVVAKREGSYRGQKSGATKANPARARALRSRSLSTTEIANALTISPRAVFRYPAARPR